MTTMPLASPLRTMLPASTWRRPRRPVDRRDDARVVQVEAGARDLRLARLDGAVQLPDLRFLADHLLRRDQLFLLQLLVALEVGLGVAQPGLVLFERALRLRQLHLVGPRVDLGQHLALRHALALGEVHPDQLAVEARAHRDGVDRRDRAERAQVDVEVLRSAAETTRTGTTWPRPPPRHRRRRRRIRRGRRRAPCARRLLGRRTGAEAVDGVAPGPRRRKPITHSFQRDFGAASEAGVSTVVFMGGAGRTDRRSYAAGPSNCCAVRAAWPAVQPHILRWLNNFLRRLNNCGAGPARGLPTGQFRGQSGCSTWIPPPDRASPQGAAGASDS